MYVLFDCRLVDLLFGVVLFYVHGKHLLAGD